MSCTNTPTFTYQTRLELDAFQAQMLDALARLYSEAERTLFARLRAGAAINDLKREFLPRCGITARQFNAIRVSLEGKIDAIRRRRPDLVTELHQRIRRAEAVIARLFGKEHHSNRLHQKKRRLALLRARLARLEADEKAGTVRLCFGGRKLFCAQFDLAANGYTSNEEWRAAWQAARARQFFVLGSGDETAGNQTCQASLQPDGTLALRLRLRLPDALAGPGGRFLMLSSVRFAYGQHQVAAALASGRRVASVTASGRATMKRTGTALSYRFLRDEKGWRVFVSCAAAPVACTTHRLAGALGIDINADHLVLAELDRHGNPVHMSRIELPPAGKRSGQVRALVGDAAVAVAALARDAGKPVVIESLDFARKKAQLEGADAKRARALSSFAYNRVIASVKAACFRAGVDVVEVNPAFTSVIGAVNHARRRGISQHQGAAIAIARRGMGLSERAAVRRAIVPVRNGGHVTFDLPARNRSKHVWLFWSDVRKRLRAALAEHVRCGGLQLPPPPLPPARPAKGATWTSAVQSRRANRHHDRSGDVLDDVPL